MSNNKTLLAFWRRFTVVTLALTVLLVAAPAWADDEDGEEEQRHVIVRKLDLENCPQWHKGSFLGVELTNLSPELRSHFGVPDDQGVMISRVVADSAASAADLRVGDIISRLDGESVASASDLGREIHRQEGGSVVEIEYFRDGRPASTTATLEEKKRCAIDIGHYLEGIDWDNIGRISQDALEGIDWETIGTESLQISNEALEQALEGLHQAFENKDWQIHFEKLEGMELEGLEERMEELQERLQELEKRIEKEAESVEREHDQARHEMERVREEMERVEAEHERMAEEISEPN